MLEQSIDVQAVRIVDRAIVFDDADDLETGARHQPGRHAAHVAEALNHHAGAGRFDAEPAQRLQRDDHAAAAGGFRAAARSAQSHRLAGDHRGHGLALVHGVGVHDPGHGLRVGVDIGRGHVALGADEVDDLGGVAARDAFQLAIGEHVGIADHAAFAAAEGDVDHGAFPGHPGSQRAHFVERDVGGEADAAFGGAARHGVLDAVAGENFQAPIVELHGNVDGEFERGGTENFAEAVVQGEAFGGLVEARFSGEPGVNFVVDGVRGFENHQVCLRLHCSFQGWEGGWSWVLGESGQVRSS